MARPEPTGKKTGRRLLDFQALKERGIPWTRVHLGRLEAAGKFPLHIDVGENSVAWFEDEIDDFPRNESGRARRQGAPTRQLEERPRWLMPSRPFFVAAPTARVGELKQCPP